MSEQPQKCSDVMEFWPDINRNITIILFLVRKRFRARGIIDYDAYKRRPAYSASITPRILDNTLLKSYIAKV